MAPGPRPIWRSRARSAQANYVNATINTTSNHNVHVHLLPRVPGLLNLTETETNGSNSSHIIAPKPMLPIPILNSTSVFLVSTSTLSATTGSTSSSTTFPASSTSSSTPISTSLNPLTPTSTTLVSGSASVLPSSTTSASPTPSQTSSLWSASYASGAGVKLAAMMDGGLILVLFIFLGVIYYQWKNRTGASPPIVAKADGGEKGQEQDGGVLGRVDAHGNEKERIGTPTLVARSGSGSGSASLSRSDTEHVSFPRSDLGEAFLGLTVPGQQKREEINEKVSGVKKV
ncbi:hypothetical protein V8F20_003154 [Naviculisporaceae sp. PSN 640]